MEVEEAQPAGAAPVALATGAGSGSSAAAPLAGKRTRGGRPVLGGHGAIWTELSTAFSSRKAKGVLGVRETVSPETVKHNVSLVRVAWAKYAAPLLGLSASSTPQDWQWVATLSDELIQAITEDDKREVTKNLFSALGVLVELIQGHPADVPSMSGSGAPDDVFTDALRSKYRDLQYTTGSSVPHTPSDKQLAHFLHYEDLERLRDHVRALRRRDDNSVETARLLGWGDLVFSHYVPRSGIPDDVKLPPGRPEILNSLCILKEEGEVPNRLNTVTASGVLHVRKFKTDNSLPAWDHDLTQDPELKRAYDWALAQRAGAKNLERLLPRRMDVYTILDRLVKGPLRTCLPEGIKLSPVMFRHSWATYRYSRVLNELRALEELMNKSMHSVTTALQYGFYSDTVTLARRVLLEGGAGSGAGTFSLGVAEVGAGSGSGAGSSSSSS